MHHATFAGEMRITLLILYLLCSFLAFGTNPGDTTDYVPECPAIIVDDCEEPKEAVYIRRFDTIASGSLYTIWQESDINPYGTDAEELPDTVSLLLVDTMECAFMMPVPGRVTSPFGPRRYRLHKGTDIDLETGDPVRSAFDGVVRVAKYHRGYGNVIVVRHYNGLETVYAHLSKISATPGDEVEAGQLLGLGGRTGRATGSHLHFEVRYLGLALDSRLLINYENGELLANNIRVPRNRLRR